jgi:hypothetical protein
MLTITFLLLCVKHFIADLYLQATYIRPSRKWIYLDSKAHLHALHHAVLTAVVFLLCWGWWWLVVVMFVVDYVTHWHIDWSKTNIARHWNWVEHTHPRAYWFLQTTDQIIHFVMYYVMVWGVGQLV